MTIKECEENIAQLKERVAARVEWAKDYQEHAGAMLREISEMKEELAALKEQLNQLMEEESAKAGEWPKAGDAYWGITVDGDVTWQHYSDTDFSADCLSIGNCFRTKEDAEFAVERLKVLAEMRKFTFEPDWKDSNQLKWGLLCGYEDGKIYFQYSVTYGEGHLVFESEERAKECVSIIGEERIKKYYFGVKP